RLANFGFQLGKRVLVVFQELASILTALANALALVAEPRAGFLEEIVVYGEKEHMAFARIPFPTQDVELGFTERSGPLVLHDFHARARPSAHFAFLYSGNAAN